MISNLLSRLVILVFGTLYPAYASYKAIKSKNVREYVKWMMYWIVFALFTCAETFTDIFFSFWFPFYYEVKIMIVIWLLCPATKGSSIMYRNFVHPWLSTREQEIDEYIMRAKEQSYATVLQLGSKGFNYASNVIMQTALKNLPPSSDFVNLNSQNLPKKQTELNVGRQLDFNDSVDGMQGISEEQNEWSAPVNKLSEQNQFELQLTDDSDDSDYNPSNFHLDYKENLCSETLGLDGPASNTRHRKGRSLK